ncbi:MAG: DUF1700 domain-containing protein [Firmicutes bacterium]|nr:DUF1700 domain-containing protein [Bacillota bacterium]
MTRVEFMTELQKKLKDMPDNEVAKILDFYSEMIADRMEEGLTEEEAVAALGSMEEIAANAHSEQPIQEKQKQKRPRWFGWGIAAIVALCLLVGGIVMADDLLDAVDDWSHRKVLTREVEEFTSIKVYPQEAEVEIRFYNDNIIKVVGRDEVVSQYEIVEYKGEIQIQIAVGEYVTKNDDLVIYLPHGDYSLLVWSDSGDINVKGYDGDDLFLYSRDGDIDLELKGSKADYTVDVRSMYGEIDAVSGTGDKMVEIGTHAGDIEVSYR